MPACAASVSPATAAEALKDLLSWNHSIIEKANDPKNSDSKAFLNLAVADTKTSYAATLETFEKEYTTIYPGTKLEWHLPVVCKRKPTGKYPSLPLPTDCIGLLALNETKVDGTSPLQPGEAYTWRPDAPPQIVFEEGTIFVRFSVYHKS